MKGADIVAKALKAEERRVHHRFPPQPDLRFGGRPRYPADHHTDRTGRGEHRRRLCPRHRRQEGRRLRGPVRPRRRERVWRLRGGRSPIRRRCCAWAGAYTAPRQLSVHPNFKASRAYAPIAKWAETVNDATWIPQMMQNAFTLMRSGRPGPVLLEFPRDVTAQEVPDEATAEYVPSRMPTKPTVADRRRRARDASRRCWRPRTPVIVAGQGILYSGRVTDLPCASSPNWSVYRS